VDVTFVGKRDHLRAQAGQEASVWFAPRQIAVPGDLLIGGHAEGRFAPCAGAGNYDKPGTHGGRNFHIDDPDFIHEIANHPQLLMIRI
jgi:hypothetical protein